MTHYPCSRVVNTAREHGCRFLTAVFTGRKHGRQVRQHGQCVPSLTINNASADTWRPFVKRFALCYLVVVCLSVCLYCITLVYCGQTVAWMTMPLGTEVALDPGHIVFDSDLARLPKRGTVPNFQPMSVVAKWLDRSRCHLVWR